MKKLLRISVLIFFLAGGVRASVGQGLPTKSLANQADEKAVIEKMLYAYQDALNASSVKDVLPLYTDDGQFLPTGAPSAIGMQQLKEAYEHVYQTIQLHVKFTIEEIVVSGDLAFARTHSQGTTLTHATGKVSAEENRELFVFQRKKGMWKISRYMFNKTK